MVEITVKYQVISVDTTQVSDPEQPQTWPLKKDSLGLWVVNSPDEFELFLSEIHNYPEYVAFWPYGGVPARQEFNGYVYYDYPVKILSSYLPVRLILHRIYEIAIS